MLPEYLGENLGTSRSEAGYFDCPDAGEQGFEYNYTIAWWASTNRPHEAPGPGSLRYDYLKLSSVGEPSNFMYYFDLGTQGARSGPSLFNPAPDAQFGFPFYIDRTFDPASPAWRGQIGFRHGSTSEAWDEGGTANAAFLDGHVAGLEDADVTDVHISDKNRRFLQ